MPLDSRPHRRLPIPAGPDALPSAPPPEVLARMTDAGRALDRLTSAGLIPHFALTSAGLRITLRDREGRPVRDISASAALELADGSFPLPA